MAIYGHTGISKEITGLSVFMAINKHSGKTKETSGLSARDIWTYRNI